MNTFKEYNLTLISQELNTNKESLNQLKKENQKLHDSLITGLILKLESEKESFLPLKELSEDEDLKNKAIKITLDEDLVYPDVKFRFVYQHKELIDFGKAFIAKYKISYKELLIFINQRNLSKEIVKRKCPIYSRMKEKEV